jgi:opacity protein-like surface antigen
MTKRIFALPALLCAVLAATPAHAQSVLPISLEARVGAAFPMGDFADGAKTGYTVGGAVHYQLNPVVGLYGGYEYARFGADSADAADVNAHFTDTGFRAGARFGVPFAGITGFHPWVEGGATLNRANIVISDDSGASISLNSGRSLGFEVGAGLDFAVAPKVTIAPGVRYRSHNADFDDSTDDSDSEVKVNYVTADLTVRIHL